MSSTRSPRLREPAGPAELELVVARAPAFAAVDEPGVEALIGTPDDALVPIGGDVMIYGDGGTGKTTLAVDLALHVAAGVEWLGIPVESPARVLLVESEGPRPLFRRKLRRRLAAWGNGAADDRLLVLEQPWAELVFTEPEHRAQLARLVHELELDVVIAGPLTRLGMDEAGTLQEVRDFAGLVDEVRRRSLRPVAFVLVHHESKAGRVSGAWEGAGDTLLHVQGQGHGRTRLYVQKARWSSTLHARTFHLRWAAGDAFEVDDDAATRPERVWDGIVDYVREHPGATWRDVAGAVKGDREYAKDRRDAMLAEGVLVNAGGPGKFELWLATDPARPSSQDELELDDDGRAETVPDLRHTLAERAKIDADRPAGEPSEMRRTGGTLPAQGYSTRGAQPSPIERAGVPPLIGGTLDTARAAAGTETDDEW